MQKIDQGWSNYLGKGPSLAAGGRYLTTKLQLSTVEVATVVMEESEKMANEEAWERKE